MHTNFQFNITIILAQKTLFPNLDSLRDIWSQTNQRKKNHLIIFQFEKYLYINL